MLHATFALAPIFAAISAFTVSTQIDVPIQRIYIPAIVYGTGVWSLSDGHVMDSNGKDVTSDQIEAAKQRFLAAGISPDHLATWTQPAATYLKKETPFLQVGVIMIDMGTPDEARILGPKVASLRTRGLDFGWNQYVAVDCAAMDRETLSGLRGLVLGPIRAMTLTTDPRTGAVDPIPLCSGSQHPTVRHAGGTPPTYVTDAFTRHVSANVEVTQSATTTNALAGTYSVFPYSMFGFPSPIIGHQNRAFVLRGGRFAATPGASDIAVPVTAALAIHTFRDAAEYATASHALARAGLPASDYADFPDAKELDVRLRGVTERQWTALEPLIAGAQVYRFIKNCAPYEEYARAVALERSHRLAQSAAQALRAPLGPLVVATDWAGPSTDAVCGSDGSGDLASLVAFAKRGQPYTDNASYYTWFTASLFAAWALGDRAPTVASDAIVDRLVSVLRSDQTGADVTGTATIVPDAYFYTPDHAALFTTSIVATKAEVPGGHYAGNVVTDCEAAQQRALVNAVKVASLDRPVASFVASPAQFLSIACLPSDRIGQDQHSIMYTADSPTGAAQVTQTITVYSASPPAHR